MIGRLIDLPLQQNTMASAKLADLVITPDLDGYTSADFMNGPEDDPARVQGRRWPTRRSSRCGPSPRACTGPGSCSHDATLPPLPVIDAIEIDPVPGIDPRRISYLVRDEGRARSSTRRSSGTDLKRIYSSGYFEIVSYAIVQDGDRNILRITPTPKSWGPTYLKLGLFLGTDFQLTTQLRRVALVDATRAERPRRRVEDARDGRDTRST